MTTTTVLFHPNNIPMPHESQIFDEQLAALWRVYAYDNPLDGCGDAEDWHEMAVRLRMGLEMLGINVDEVARTGNVANHTRGSMLPSVNQLKLDMNVWGVLPNETMSGHGMTFVPEDIYWHTATFARNSGRKIEYVSYDNFEDRVRELLVDGHEAVRYKSIVRSKDGVIGRVTKSDVDEVFFENAMTFDRVLGFDVDATTVMIYPEVPMHFETRFFVVNGEVVTGSGAYVNFTPCHNTGELFHTVGEYVRGDGLLVDYSDRFDNMLALANEVAAGLKYEGFDTYVLDMALDDNDVPMVVETNGIHNAGLFAINEDALTDALIEHNDGLRVYREMLPLRKRFNLTKAREIKSEADLPG